jgi:hypothetical protein
MTKSMMMMMMMMMPPYMHGKGGKAATSLGVGKYVRTGETGGEWTESRRLSRGARGDGVFDRPGE